MRRIQTLCYCFAFTVAVAVAVAAGVGDARAENAVTPVSVQNPITLNQATPNPVTIVSQPKVTPYAASATFDQTTNPFQFFPPLPPAGKLLIVEFFSANCGASDINASMRIVSANIQASGTTLGAPSFSVSNANLPPPNSAPNSPFGASFTQFGQPMRVYVGTHDAFGVSVFARLDGANNSIFGCTVSITGQLIDS
jgi:hypothetical protein